MPHDFVPLRDQAPLMIRKPSSVSRTGESLENQHRCRGGLAPRRHWLAAVLRSFSGFLMTALIALALFGVLYFYSEILLIMTSATKKEFNALVTGLSIALGLSVTLGFSSMISTLRWWILGRKHHSLPKIDLIIQMDSIVQLVSLGCKTRSIGTHLTILIWVVVITGTQVALAAMGLAYGVEVASSRALVVTPGKVITPDMRTIQLLPSMPGATAPKSTQEYIANSYGQASLVYKAAGIDRIPEEGQLRDGRDPVLFCDVATCQFVFYTWPAGPDTDSDDNADSDDSADSDESEQGTVRLTMATNRSLKTNSTCDAWPVVATDTASMTVTLDRKDESGSPPNISFPLVPGSDQTVYTTRTNNTCGVGCAVITALETTLDKSWLYNCTVKVGTVSNATRPEHQIGDEVRNLAAASVALQGYVSEVELGSAMQRQVYPAQSITGYPNLGVPETMAFKLAMFSAGVIAVMADFNGPVAVDGIVPEQAQTLEVEHWGWVTLILLGVTALHFALSAITLWASLRAVVPGGSPITLARILESVTCKFSRENGSDPASVEGPARWVYKARLVPELNMYDVFFERQEPGPVVM